ncbi:MAG: hypothetical protein RQ833_06045 [Sphingomonadaceae bacterium]|nr:hypothetical protein [Sphingomonadaceae bacterium]
MIARLIPALAFLALTAAAPQSAQPTADAPDDKPKKEVPDARKKTIGDETGVKKRKVPPHIQMAFDAPYSRQGTQSCAAITQQVVALNKELGPDLDDEPYKSPSDMGYYARRAGDVLLGPIGMVRDIVGEVSGARKSRDRLQAAIVAGAVRRGYLKGLGMARGCKGYAAPTIAAQRAAPLAQNAETERERREDAAESKRPKAK